MTSPADLSPSLVQTVDGVIVRVYVQPQARRAQLIGMHADRLKLAVTEPPDKGKANAAVIQLLSTAVRLPASQVELLRGMTSRKKDLLLRGRKVGEVAALLMAGLENKD